MNRIVRLIILFIFAFSVLLVFQQMMSSNDPLVAAAKQPRGFIPSAEEVFKEKPSTEFVPSTIAPQEAGGGNPGLALTKASAQENASGQDGIGSIDSASANIANVSGETNEDRLERYKRGEIDFYLLRQTRYYEDQPPAFPKELTELKDKKIKMMGFMSPYDDLNNMKNFMLMPMVSGCFFCVPPSIEEVLLIRQESDEQCPYIAEPIVIEGTLRLWSKENENPVFEMFLYIIEDANVRAYDPEKDARKPITQDHNNPH